MRIRKPIERWFKVPGDDDNAEIKIRKLTPGELFAIYDATFEQVITYDTDGMPEMKQVSNKDADRKLTATKAVVDWKNMFDEDGSLMVCNPANIEKAVDGIQGFFAFVRKCMTTLDNDLEKEKKAQEKN